VERAKYIGRRYSGPAPCYSFVRDALADAGLTFPEHQYGKAEHDEALRRHLAEYAEPVTVPQAGDVILLRIGGHAAHIGIMVNQQEFLHPAEKHGVIRESITAWHWRSRVSGYYRPRILEPAP
jgi:cell wall-associated NlpC family hydrolase